MPRGRPRKVKLEGTSTPTVEVVTTPVKAEKLSESKDLVNALVEAIQLTKPVEKKTAANRVSKTPWTPKNGEKKLKLRRKMYQHGIPIDPDLITNEEIELLNKLKTGRFLDGWVKVYKRKDSGIDIDYPVKTASQRIKLVSQFGIRNLAELLQKCITEKEVQFANRDKYVDEE